MARQIAPHRRYGYISLVDRLKIGAAFGTKAFANLAYPVIKLAARVDVFADHRPCALKALLRNANARGNPFGTFTFSSVHFGIPSATVFCVNSFATFADSVKS